MFIRRLLDDRLAQAAWLIGCQRSGEAIVVDPLRDPDRYLAAARAEGLRVAMVAETHIHADFLSGSRELSHRTGAELLLSGEGGEEWSYRFAEPDGATLLRDGDTFMVGKVRFESMHTPGHTPEHLSFLVTDTANAEAPIGLLSGDFLFVGDVGRPDLLERAAGRRGTMEAAAGTLFGSLRRLDGLPDHLQIWPGHGAGSACGKALGAVPTSTLGYERLVNPALSHDDEEAFVRWILADQPEAPRYFGEMKRANRDGPPPLPTSLPPREDDARLPELLAEDAIVIDVRGAEVWREGHLRGTRQIPLNRSFTKWAGWLLPYDRDLRLIAADGAQAFAAVKALRTIGLDRVAGWFGPEAVTQPGAPRGDAPVVPVDEAWRRMGTGTPLVDVRAYSEIVEGRPAGARPIHLGHLPDRLDELRDADEVLVACRTGARSAIAQSVLRATGIRAIDVEGGFEAWRAAGLPERKGAPP